MKNKFFAIVVKLSLLVGGCFLLTSFSPSLDGRAVVVEDGIFPQGLFAKTVGYLPGDIISVANISGDSTVDLLVIGALDPSEGVAIMLSPEAAEAVGIERDSNSIVKITKRSGQDERVYGTAVIAKSAENATAASEPSPEPVSEPEELPVDEEPFEETVQEEYPADEPLAPMPVEEETENVPEEPVVEQPEETPVEEENAVEEPVEEEPVEEEPAPESVFETIEATPYEEPVEETVPAEYVDDSSVQVEEEPAPVAEEIEEEIPPAEEPIEETVEQPIIEEEYSEEITPTEEPIIEEYFEDEGLEPLPTENISEEVENEDIGILTEDIANEEFVDETPAEIPEEPAPAPEEEPAPAEEIVPVIPVIEAVEEPAPVEEVPEEVPAEEEYIETDELESLPVETPEEEMEEYEAIVLVPADSNPPVVEEPAPEEDEVEIVDTTLAVVENVEEITDEVESVEPEPTPEPVIVPTPKPAPKSSKLDKYIVPSLKELESGKYYIQIAAMADDENILKIIDLYGNHYPITLVPMANGITKQILIGPLSVDEYKVVLERFKSYGYKDAFLRKIK